MISQYLIPCKHHTVLPGERKGGTKSSGYLKQQKLITDQLIAHGLRTLVTPQAFSQPKALMVL